jgi:hypothetical protein
MRPQALPQGEFLIAAIIGGLIAGLLCGLFPFALAKSRGRLGFGVAALFVCIICGGILGLLLAGPVAAVFSFVIVSMGKAKSDRNWDDDDDWDRPRRRPLRRDVGLDDDDDLDVDSEHERPRRRPVRRDARDDEDPDDFDADNNHQRPRRRLPERDDHGRDERH